MQRLRYACKARALFYNSEAQKIALKHLAVSCGFTVEVDVHFNLWLFEKYSQSWCCGAFSFRWSIFLSRFQFCLSLHWFFWFFLFNNRMKSWTVWCLWVWRVLQNVQTQTCLSLFLLLFFLLLFCSLQEVCSLFQTCFVRQLQQIKLHTEN